MGRSKSEDDDDLCSILRTVRIAQDLSTREVADKMNVRTSYITDVERGDRTPSISTLDKYCEALNISPDNIFAWRQEQKEKKYPYKQLLRNILDKIITLDAIQSETEAKLQDLQKANH